MLRIVTDSTSDLTAALAAESGVELIPLHVIIGGKTYAEGVDLSKEQFYERLAVSKELPSTSQPSPAVMQKYFQRYLDAGDDVIYIGVSSRFSGTLQAARIGRDLVSEPERVTIYDSMSVSYGQGLLALHAAKLAREGKTPAEITAALDDLRPRIHIVFSVGGLDNLRKSGRINNLSFLFGSLLNIKPIMMIDRDSVVQVYEKARGKKNAYRSLFRYLEEFPPDPAFAFGLGHTHDPEQAATYRQDLQALGITDLLLFEIGAVIGTHVGIGTIGFLYVSKK
ncbi:MAG TPA: DegV family protein [Bacilli bacterium]|nr:DegV family protein [Bacilli bacterium]